MLFKSIYFALNVSVQEGLIDENGRKDWTIDKNVKDELGVAGSFTPNLYEFQLSPNTYDIKTLNANEVYPAVESSLILKLGFIQNTGENDCLIGYRNYNENQNFPIVLKPNDSIYIRGEDTVLMSTLLLKSINGTTIKFLFSSDATFNRILDLDGNIIVDSLNREVVGFL